MPDMERPISAVLRDIAGNLQHIVRSEFRLARTEVSEELGKVRSASILLAVGMMLLGLSVLFAVVAIVYALSQVVPAWMAALIVAAGLGLLAAVFCSSGFRKMKSVRVAPRTATTLKENVEWARQLSK